MSAYFQQMSSVDYFKKLQERVGHTRDKDFKDVNTRIYKHALSVWKLQKLRRPN